MQERHLPALRRSATSFAVLALLLLIDPAAAAPPPLTAEQEKALAALAGQDDAETNNKALDALSGVTDKKTLDRLADFGMGTWHPALTLRAADLLVAAGADAAGAALVRAKPRASTRADRLARLVHMAERVPGKPGLEVLTGLLEHPNDLAAGLAARALGARKEVAARPALEGMLKSGKPVLATSAAYALANLPADDKIRELLWTRVENAGKDHVGDSCSLALSSMEGAAEYGKR